VTKKKSVKKTNIKKGTDLNKTNKYVNSASQIPPEKDNGIYRSIRFKADIKTLVVRTEIGYDLIFDLQPQIRVNPYEETDKGTPKFQTSIVWALKGARPRGSVMKVSEIELLVKDRSLLPLDVDWDIAQLGFVYSNAKDPNNHRWWIEGLKTGKQMGQFDSIMSEYTKSVSSSAPIGTRSWFDGIHHGRFTFAKDNIESSKEISKGHVFIEGNGKGRLGDIESNVDIPEECTTFRLRFDIRKDIWITEMLNIKGELVGESLISKNIKSDAKFKGHIVPNNNRPKVSGMILRDDVESINETDQLVMIKGRNV
jgi:hypothetical protein